MGDAVLERQLLLLQPLQLDLVAAAVQRELADTLIQRAMRRPEGIQPGVDLRPDRPFVHYVTPLPSEPRSYSTGFRAEATSAGAAAGAEALAMTRLIADIGGTNARFALVDGTGPVADERHLLVRDHPDPASAIEAYLGGRRVTEAVIAVATPVESDEIGFTNSPWTFSIQGLQQRLGLSRLAVINDFVAQALAMPHLSRDEVALMGGGAPAPGRAVGVLGAGTGLGVSALVPGKAMRRYLAGLRPIQEALGDYNDLLVAEALSRDSAPVAASYC
mgnify:CR=1 FL=1